jgi:hypothetical protein
MARFQLIKLADTPGGTRWGIEEIVPGEKPITLPFYGKRVEALAELSRLNLYGRKTEQLPVATSPRDSIPMAKGIGDIVTGQVVDAVEDGKDAGAAAGGRKGGAARSKALSPRERGDGLRRRRHRPQARPGGTSR